MNQHVRPLIRPEYDLALAPFVEMLRELAEMRYLWDNTVLLDNTKLVKTLGASPTPPWKRRSRPRFRVKVASRPTKRPQPEANPCVDRCEFVAGCWT